MSDEDQAEAARQELIRRGVLKEQPPHETPESPGDPPGPPPPPESASWLCVIKHRWSRWHTISVTVMAGDRVIGEKTHLRRDCPGCGKIQISEAFV